MGKRNQMHCIICVKYPDTVRQFGLNRKSPPVTTINGTQYRKITCDEHLKSQYHFECVQRLRRSEIRTAGIAGSSTPLEKMISTANEKLANLIGRYAFTVYNDAKRLTLSAWSWPARAVAQEFGVMYNINEPTKNLSARGQINLQYLNPGSHAEILDCIVHVESTLIAKKINECLALSMRCDGSVDRTNLDKIYVIAKMVNIRGQLETMFIGVGEQKERGAQGLHECFKNIINAHGENLYQQCVKKMTSFVTDGASVNVGEHKGLWRLIDNDAELFGATQNILKIWCAAHRSDLAVKDLNKTVPEVPEIIKFVGKIAAFINRSAMRESLLKKIASENNVNLMKLPKSFDVRWAEYTKKLLHAVLKSWHALVLFFRAAIDLRDEEAKAQGYLNFLTNLRTLEMISFLCDVFFHITNFQLKLQADDLNLVTLNQCLNDFKRNIYDMNEEVVMSGWEENLTIELRKTDPAIGLECLKGIALTSGELERRGQATRTRTFPFLRKEILQKVYDNTTVRFSLEEDLYSVLLPFANLDQGLAGRADIRRVHSLLCPDLDLALVNSEYKDVCTNPQLNKIPLRKLVVHLAEFDSTSSYTNIKTAISRFLAATPHSADVERSISANNLLKTNLRSSIKIDTENKYLFVHFNLPVVTEWEPERAVVRWLTAKDRRVHNLLIENEAKRNIKREYFNGVFPHTNSGDKDEELDKEHSYIIERDELQPPSKRRKF